MNPQQPIRKHIDVFNSFNSDCMMIFQVMHQEQEIAIAIKKLQEPAVSEEDTITEIERIKSCATQTINDLADNTISYCNKHIECGLDVETTEDLARRIMIAKETAIYIVEKTSDAAVTTIKSIKSDNEIEKVKAEATKELEECKRIANQQFDAIIECLSK